MDRIFKKHFLFKPMANLMIFSPVSFRATFKDTVSYMGIEAT